MNRQKLSTIFSFVYDVKALFDSFAVMFLHIKKNKHGLTVIF